MLYEDAAPYYYLTDQVKGRPHTADIRFLFIDEAQDYTNMQIAYLKNLFPQARITLLGDIDQAVHRHTAEDYPSFQPLKTKKRM
ncbi:DNA helicase [Geomicrobium sp. JCM 19037]|uniref:UvrD-helicase domain-containing protein n=1 Tax=Geomicrobium sp. JCM 19037 TaxID=1460634 RepID=UPI00045F3214|nr:UvrD-helicase domain-containing protein [Geomicrobium sp. JCM 19037]GAK06125.1 DNA helicase [Geomicrobium sp. JCM 19037]